MKIFTEDRLLDLLQQVLDDATGDVENSGKRVWPIRATLYREIAKELGREPKEDGDVVKRDHNTMALCNQGFDSPRLH